MEEDYSKEPTYYCKACLSLHIVEDDGQDICGSCGAVNFVAVVPYEEYEKIANENNSELKS